MDMSWNNDRRCWDLVDVEGSKVVVPAAEASLSCGNDDHKVIDTLFNLDERNIMSSMKGRIQLTCCRTKEYQELRDEEEEEEDFIIIVGENVRV